MVNQEDRKVAALLIDEALNNRGLEKSRWLRQLLQSGDSEFHILLKERREMVGRHLGWAKPGRRVVPDNQITQFVVDCLGVDILRFPQIRYLLIENGREISNSEFDVFLNYIPTKFSFGNDPSAEQISSIEIGVGTTLARQFCKFVNLPLSFSTRGSSDERSNFEEIQASKSLPDLVDFQEIVRKMLTEKCLEKKGKP